MPHCLKSHVVAQIYFIANTEDSPTVSVSTGSTVNVSTGSTVSGVSTGSTVIAAAGLGSLSEEEGEIKEDTGEK